MEIHTRKTQEKLAALLVRFRNGEFDNPAPGAEQYEGQWAAGWMLAHLLPVISGEIYPVVRQDERRRIHDRIEAELVCCDLYERMNLAGMTADEYRVFTVKGDYHAICHYGGWAANLAIEDPRLILEES